ncbi:MAG: sensor histidine kinase [Eubacterium sp.]|nr:sensor histidine kinase [Eubacterium sp.]
MTFVSLVLLLTGTQASVLLLLLVILFVLQSLILITNFFKCRAHLEELESILSGLDQKYLFAECIPQPETIYERQLFDLMRRSYRSMVSAVSDAQSAQKEYREYVESWVHEIKSPITAAKLICHSTDAESGRKLTQELAQIEAHVERALFYARAESPERDFVVRQVNLEEIVSSAIENHRSLLMQSGVRIETDNLNYPVYTDSKWACFIIGQLLQNAARYHKTSCARLQDSLRELENPEQFLMPQDTPVILISASLQDKQLALTVSDNGIGIPAHELPRVFDRGFTGSNGRVKGGSTGMGLYLCRKLSGLLNMDIQIASIEQQGTQVTLSFPVKQNLTKM